MSGGPEGKVPPDLIFHQFFLFFLFTITDVRKRNRKRREVLEGWDGNSRRLVVILAIFFVSWTLTLIPIWFIFQKRPWLKKRTSVCRRGYLPLIDETWMYVHQAMKTKMKWRLCQRGRRRSHKSCHHSPCNESKISMSTHRFLLLGVKSFPTGF